jgi:recombination protein RecT
MNTNGEAGAAATTPTREKGNAVAKPKDSIGAMIEKLKPQLERALPKHVTPDRLARVALTAVRNNPKLGQADAYSLMGSIMQAAQLGLEPNTPLGQCYIIPYKNGKTGRFEAQFQMGYKGIVDLAHRSGQYQRVAAFPVDKADEFRYEYGLESTLVHKPADKPSGEITHYYAVYRLTNGGYDFRVWSREQVQAHAEKYSQSWDAEKKRFIPRSTWATAFDAMACKTVLIDLLRYAPKSVEIATATAADSRTYRIDPDDPELNLDTIDGDFELESEGGNE